MWNGKRFPDGIFADDSILERRRFIDFSVTYYNTYDICFKSAVIIMEMIFNHYANAVIVSKCQREILTATWTE